VGCSDRFPGFTCKNETEAANWPKRCLGSDDKLCKRGAGAAFNISVSVYKRFELYSEAGQIGDGDGWGTDHFSSDATEYLWIKAEGSSGNIRTSVILSTSEGLVTDGSWKCLDVQNLDATNMPPFNQGPDALVLGQNGGPGRPSRPDISSDANFITAPDLPSGAWAKEVDCYKKLGGFVKCSNL
jgi:hypothetical protein